MNRTRRQLTRLATLAATILGLVLVTATQASAMRPEPAPTDPGSVSQAPATPTVLHVSESSVSLLQWVLFTAAVVGALLIGAALMQVSQRRRARLAH